MFDNIGSKIKTAATVFCVLGILASLICAITLWASNSRYNDTTFIGFIVLIAGSLFSWLGSFFAYGFGELIEQNAKILKTNHMILISLSSPAPVSGQTSSRRARKAEPAPEQTETAPVSHEQLLASREQLLSRSIHKNANTSIDPQWKRIDDTMVQCPQCGSGMTVDYIRMRRRCPDCNCEYIPS